VRTSLGTPRWFQAPLLELRSVMPYGLFGKDLEPEEFTRRYRHRLHRQGPRVLADLAELREGYGDVCLLCFEGSDAFCHRHVLRVWLQEHGIPVEEVVPTPP
jgi:uncharacterized protein YeaO (DUF488 family)